MLCEAGLASCSVDLRRESGGVREHGSGPAGRDALGWIPRPPCHMCSPCLTLPPTHAWLCNGCYARQSSFQRDEKTRVAAQEEKIWQSERTADEKRQQKKSEWEKVDIIQFFHLQASWQGGFVLQVNRYERTSTRWDQETQHLIKSLKVTVDILRVESGENWEKGWIDDYSLNYNN